MQTTHDHRLHDAGDRPVVKSETQARQGATGHNVRYVLGTALAAVVIGFAAVYIYYFAG
jgi:hypothetical protein